MLWDDWEFSDKSRAVSLLGHPATPIVTMVTTIPKLQGTTSHQISLQQENKSIYSKGIISGKDALARYDHGVDSKQDPQQRLSGISEETQ